jgi:hypothetical protein
MRIVKFEPSIQEHTKSLEYEKIDKYLHRKEVDEEAEASICVTMCSASFSREPQYVPHVAYLRTVKRSRQECEYNIDPPKSFELHVQVYIQPNRRLSTQHACTCGCHPVIAHCYY